MRCFVVGSKELSVRVLEELVAQGHQVTGVLSRDHEDGMRVWLDKLGHKSLKARAWQLGIPVFEKIGVNSQEMVEVLTEMALDALFSVFWGEIIKTPVLSLPRLGCFNLHTAYLPRNRGCFPMAWAIIEDEEHAGLTIHRMTPGVDDGPIVAQVKVPIAFYETGESLYRKVTEAGHELFRETLPKIASGTFTLTPQQGESTYHPRGYPYGGQVNPYWEGDKKRRFINALHFPPFKGATLGPPRYLEGHDSANVRVVLGFDCDRPRGAFVAGPEGEKMAIQKVRSLERIACELDVLEIPRTLFICGLWLESMAYKVDVAMLRVILRVVNDNPLVEIADHGYSHSVVKAIASRPDKQPIGIRQAADEYRRNTGLFRDILGLDLSGRGYRAPLGHFGGLKGKYRLLDKLLALGARYVSSDLRGPGDLLNAPLNVERQPYRYENGLLEIPSHGWQDTAFSGRSKTPGTEEAPRTYDEIMVYYRNLFALARQIAWQKNRDYFLGLVFHPYDISLYAESGFLSGLCGIVDALGGSFCKYEDVWRHYQ